MTNLGKVLKRLEKAGYQVMDKLEIESHVEFLGEKDVINQYRANFAVKYNKKGQFTIETTFSNQEITEEWFAELKKLRLILK